MAWTEDAMADRWWFWWQTRLLCKRVLVWEPTLQRVWNIAAETLHSMWYTCSFWHELELLCVKVELRCFCEMPWLVHGVSTWLIELHWNLATTNGICQILADRIILHFVISSLHLSEFSSFEHFERFGNVYGALLVGIACWSSLIVNFYRSIIPVALLCSRQKIWLLVCSTSHLKGKWGKLGPISIHNHIVQTFLLRRINCSEKRGSGTFLHKLRTSLNFRLCMEGAIIDHLRGGCHGIMTSSRLLFRLEKRDITKIFLSSCRVGDAWGCHSILYSVVVLWLWQGLLLLIFQVGGALTPLGL